MTRKTTIGTIWTKAQITVGKNGESFPGLQSGNLGIARPPMDQWSDWGSCWRLAHQPSGLGFGRTFATLKNAQRAATLILALISPDELDLIVQDDPSAWDRADQNQTHQKIKTALRDLD